MIKRRYSDDGRLLEVRRLHNGRLHCDGQPAYISYIGGKVCEIWYQHNKLHRENGPAIVIYKGGCCIEEQYFENGEYINQMPNVIKYYPNGNKKIEYYWKSVNFNPQQYFMPDINSDIDVFTRIYYPNGQLKLVYKRSSPQVVHYNEEGFKLYMLCIDEPIDKYTHIKYDTTQPIYNTDIYIRSRIVDKLTYKETYYNFANYVANLIDNGLRSHCTNYEKHVAGIISKYLY